ncbi:MAG TPA: hypothetical protein PLL26_02790 [Candidatus Dojkabacteria bacterium]|nr:hypothetical protein [Candidatus Dojkabacteria bacterium]
MAQFPFAKPKDAPAAAPTATPAPAAPAAEVPKTKGVKKSGEDRKKPAAQMTSDQVKQILSLVKTSSYSEIAEKVGVTKFQVNRVLMSTKKQLREAAAGDAAKLAKVEAYIKEYLSRPEDTLPGKGGARGGKVKGAVDSLVGDILASIS